MNATPSSDEARSRSPLDAEVLLWAYRHGIFPMADPDSGRIDWFSPDPRGIIPLDAFHVPKNLAREVRRGHFDIRSDTAFDAIMRACGERRSDDDGTWIDEQMIRAYSQLQRLGHAHSVEAWLDEELVGGLYGVHIGGAFFGESMFTRPSKGGTNASKICLVHLVRWVRRQGFILLDVQFWTDHLGRFGCQEIDRQHYLSILARALERDAPWGEFRAERG